MLTAALAALAVVGAVCAHPHDGRDVRHSHGAKSNLPRSTWFHPEGHHTESLFRRADGSSPPAVGSPAWTAAYPDPQAGWPPTSVPQAWTDTLNAAIAAGKIPNIPIPTMGADGNPAYPGGVNQGLSKEVCSATFECEAPGDIWDGPDGTVALAFDDGPLPPSPTLYAFLKTNNQHATHFFIGHNIRSYPTIFLQAFQDNQDDIGVHTYTHPYLTLQTNEGLLAELGWTIQIIHDSTGGRIPKFLRPPYGDTDNRVRAIAREVFGLTTVVWNQDSEDWKIGAGGTLATTQGLLTSFYNMPKSPGLLILEHELTDSSVSAFIGSWGLMHSKGWKPITIPDAANATTGVPGSPNAWYQNAVDDLAPVVGNMTIGVGPASLGPGGSGSSSTGSTSSTSTGSGSPSNSAPSGSNTSKTSGSSSSSSSSSSTSPSPSNAATTSTQSSALSPIIALFAIVLGGIAF